MLVAESHSLNNQKWIGREEPGDHSEARGMELKLSIPNFAFPIMRWERSLRLIRDLEVNAVDVGVFATGSNLCPEDVLPDPSSAARRIATDLLHYDLEIADVFGIAGRTFEEKALNHIDVSERKAATEFFWRLLEFAVRCNAKHLTLLPGVPFESEDLEESMKRAAEELLWRTEAASKLGIVLAVEPHVGSMIATPELARRLIAVVPGLTLTVDYSHFAVQGISHDEIEPLFALASHFHLRGACKGRLQTSLKENTVDFPRVMAGVGKRSYGGYIALEYIWTEWMHCNEVDNVSEIIQLRNLLRGFPR